MFTSLRLEGVDTTSGSGSDEGCAGKTFTIKLYEEEGNQFPPSYEISVDSEGVFSSPSGDTDGALEGDENSSVTLTFDESLIDAELVYRITIESSSTQASPASYEVGDIGPGGGKIFYVDANGFNCGPLFNETGSPTQEKCNYLEAAPTTGINAWTDAVFEWSGNTGDLIDTTSESIGSGYQNSNQMIQQSPSGDTPGRAATISRAYRGPNDKEDWYLPSSNELNELLLQRTTVGATEDYYWWSSTESGSIAALIRALNGDLSASLKNQILFVRPIRAF
jgi:hypothetical protein